MKKHLAWKVFSWLTLAEVEGEEHKNHDHPHCWTLTSCRRLTLRTQRNLMNLPSSVHLHLSYLYVNVHSGLCCTASIWGLNVQQRWKHIVFSLALVLFKTSTLWWGFFFNCVWFYKQSRVVFFLFSLIRCLRMSVHAVLTGMCVIVRRDLMSSSRLQERFLSPKYSQLKKWFSCRLTGWALTHPDPKKKNHKKQTSPCRGCSVGSSWQQTSED